MSRSNEYPETPSPSPFLAEYRGSFLSADGRTLDALLRINLELGAELWVVKERARVLEKLLVEAGVVAPDAIEKTHINPRTKEERDRRAEYINTIFRHLLLGNVDDPLDVVSPQDIQTPMHGDFAKKL